MPTWSDPGPGKMCASASRCDRASAAHRGSTVAAVGGGAPECDRTSETQDQDGCDQKPAESDTQKHESFSSAPPHRGRPSARRTSAASGALPSARGLHPNTLLQERRAVDHINQRACCASQQKQGRRRGIRVIHVDSVWLIRDRFSLRLPTSLVLLPLSTKSSGNEPGQPSPRTSSSRRQVRRTLHDSAALIGGSRALLAIGPA